MRLAIFLALCLPLSAFARGSHGSGKFSALVIVTVVAGFAIAWLAGWIDRWRLTEWIRSWPWQTKEAIKSFVSWGFLAALVGGVAWLIATSK